MENIHGNIIIDFDDILANTSESLFNHIKNSWLIYSPYLKYVPFTYDVNTRERRDLYMELLKPDLNMLLLQDAIAVFYNYYLTNKEMFVQYLTMTDLYNKVIKSSIVENGNKIDKIYVPYGERLNSEKYTETQHEIYSQLFSDFKKVELLDVEQKKSEKLKTVDWNLYITDDVKTIVELIEDKDYNIEGKEFLILDRPYSKLTPEQELLIQEKGATINYYK